MKRYKRIRYKIYAVSLILSFFIFITTFYIYLIEERSLISMLMWIISIIIIITIVSYPLIKSKFRYYEYKKKIEEKRFLETDKREKEDLLRIEEEILAKLETNLSKRIHDALNTGNIEKDFVDLFQGIYELFHILGEKRMKRFEAIETDERIKNLINKLSSDVFFENISKEYPQLEDVFNNLLKLSKFFMKKDITAKQTRNLIGDFLQSVVEVTVDTHLMVVIKSDERLISVYNEIVNIYQYYETQFEEKESKEKELFDLEKDFKYTIDIIAKDRDLNSLMQDSKYALSLYNILVDVYNRYKKKEELYREIHRTQEEEI